MGLDFLLQKVKDAIYKDDNTTYKEGDQHGLIGQVEGLFGGLLGGGNQQGGNAAPGTINNPLPASQDRYGDPADQFPQQGGYNNQGNQGDLQQQYPNLRPASEDPNGDPADQSPQGQTNNPNDLRQRFPNLKPASEDPHGDPADQR